MEVAAVAPPPNTEDVDGAPKVGVAGEPKTEDAGDWVA
jgi:hypothetical protein